MASRGGKHMKPCVEAMEKLAESAVSYSCSSIWQTPHGLVVDLSHSQSVLPRSQTVTSTTSYLVSGEKDENSFCLNEVPQQKPSVLASQKSEDGSRTVLFRKGEKDETEVWLEVWGKNGILLTKNVKTTVSKIYNDQVFGGIKWNSENNRICFIGEIPEPAKYESYFDLNSREEEEEEEEEKEKDNSGGEEEKEKEEEEKVWNSKKFEFEEDFGEMLVGKKKPAIFVYDLQTDELRRVALDLENVYPGFPCFDETGSGIVFHGFSLPSKKLGLIYCLNRPTALYHIKDVRFVPKKKKGSVEHEKSVSVCLTKSLAVAFQPFFSKDFSKLVFVGREEMFLHHSGNYELYCVDWKDSSQTQKKIISRFPDYPGPSDSFVGLYGYRITFTKAGFLDPKGHFFAFQSIIKGQNRVYVVETESQKVHWIGFHDRKDGDYELLMIKDNFLVFRMSSHNVPPQVCLVRFPLEKPDPIPQFTIQLLKESAILDQELNGKLLSIKQETISLENGAEGYLQYIPSSPREGEEDKKVPLVMVIHGGPFGASPKDAFLISRNLLLLQGFALLVVNYRGSIGYGEKFMDELLGTIGQVDVEDCANLCKHALKSFPDLIDANRVGVFGGSHGGFLAGWLIGHPEFNSLFKVGCLWNPVLNMSYMVQATDITDWIVSCNQNRQFDSMVYNEKDNDCFFQKSPFSVVQNVSCPTLLVVGSKDLRVPPHQSIYYYNALREKGVATKLFMYPESGHALLEIEFYTDANLNIAAWFNQYL